MSQFWEYVCHSKNEREEVVRSVHHAENLIEAMRAFNRTFPERKDSVVKWVYATTGESFRNVRHDASLI